MSKKDFSVIVVPDTQNVSTSYPYKLLKMAKWIVDHAEELNLKMVLHVGDVINHGDQHEWQWKNHKAAFDLIDQADIPMLIGIGNHDYDNLLAENRDSEWFNMYCGYDRYKGKPWFGGMFEENKAENIYATLDAEGRKLLFLSLEFGPRDEVITWANAVLENHTDYEVTVITHSFMYIDGERTSVGDNHNPNTYEGADGANDGETLWEKFVKRHKNIVSVYSGHHVNGSISYRLDQGDHENKVFQSFQNWQLEDNGGEGRIRVLQYRPAENRVDLYVVNPQTDEYEKKDGYEINHPLPH